MVGYNTTWYPAGHPEIMEIDPKRVKIGPNQLIWIWYMGYVGHAPYNGHINTYLRGLYGYFGVHGVRGWWLVAGVGWVWDQGWFRGFGSWRRVDGTGYRWDRFRADVQHVHNCICTGWL